jgi:hypothetical protein
MTRCEVLKKYPRIVAHLICESLGYYCVLSAAGVLHACIENEPYFCEWHSHMSNSRYRDQPAANYNEVIRMITRDVVHWAIARRHSHRGYMAEYKHAITLVKRELESEGATGSMLASWF